MFTSEREQQHRCSELTSLLSSLYNRHCTSIITGDLDQTVSTLTAMLTIPLINQSTRVCISELSKISNKFWAYFC